MKSSPYLTRWLACLLALMMNSITVFSQDTPPDPYQLMQEPDANFFEIKERMDNYFTAHPPILEEEDGPFEAYQKWLYLWRPRCNNGSRPDEAGKFTHAQNAFNSVLANPICNGNNNGSHWTLVGPQYFSNSNLHVNGVVSCIHADPNTPNKVYMGTTNSGVWICDDISQTNVQWYNPTDQYRWPGMGVNDVVVDPTNSQIVYAGTGVTRGGPYGIGVIKSTDGGQSWFLTGLNFNPLTASSAITIYRIIIDPSNNQRLMAMTGIEVYETTDAGVNWTPLAIPPAGAIRDMEFDQVDPLRLFVSGDQLLEYYSGSGWVSPLLTGSSPTNIKLSKSGSNVYAMYIGSATWRIDKYTSGSGWTNYSTTGAALTNAVFEMSPANSSSPNVVYNESTSRLLYKSIDGGVTWAGITNYNPNTPFLGVSTHADIRSFYLINGSTNGLTDEILCGSDGGILYSASASPNYNSVAWKDLNGDLALNQFFGITDKEQPSEVIVGGTQDDGAFTKDATGWHNTVLGGCIGDAYEAIYDKTTGNTNNVYVEANNPSMSKSSNNGVGWSCFSSPTWHTGNGFIYRAVGYDANDNAYNATDEVFKLTGPGWTQVTNFNDPALDVPGCRAIIAIAGAPSNPDVMYVGLIGQT